MPIVVSEVVVEYGECEISELNTYSLKDYKLGMETLTESEEDCADNAVPQSKPMHKICFPDANHVILLAAEKNIGLLEEYLDIADEDDRRFLLFDYMDICSDNPSYDKKHKIIKKLSENNCQFCNSEDKNVEESYHERLKRALRGLPK